MQGALHDHDVFEVGVDRPAHDNAAAEVSPNVGILDQEVLDGGAIGLGKKARIALGIQDLILVVQALHGMVLTVKDALKGMFFVAKGKVLDRILNNGIHIIIVKNDIVIEIDAPLRRVALSRQRDTRQEIVPVCDMEFGLILGMRCRRQHHNAAKGDCRHGNQPAEHASVHVLDLHRLVRLRPAHDVKHVEDGIACMLVFGLHGLNIDIEPE